MLVASVFLAGLLHISICEPPAVSQAPVDHGVVDINQEQKTFLVRSLTAINVGTGTKMCEAEEHCESKQRCDPTVKLCYPKDTPEFPLILPNVTCETNYQCPFLYRCATGTCQYFFFKSCRSTADCLQSAEWSWECRERSEQMPGRQCYKKCLIDRDCYECNGGSCRYPEYFQKIISCCDGYCSKKIACDLDTVP